jgi:peptide deformylase
MSILKVARMGHPVLRSRARALDRAEIKSAAIQSLIDDMIETMEEYQGIGLAAPQVHEGVRVFIAGLQEDARSDDDDPAIVPVPLVNPEIAPVAAV